MKRVYLFALVPSFLNTKGPLTIVLADFSRARQY